MQVIQIPNLRTQTIPEKGSVICKSTKISILYLGTGNKNIWILILYNSRLWNSRILTKWNQRKKWLVRSHDVSLYPGYDQFDVFFIWKVKIKGMQLYLSTYIFVLSVSSIEAWTRLKYWKVIRLMEKLWCPHRNFIFKQPEIYVEGSQSGRSWVKADGRKPTVIFHKVH